MRERSALENESSNDERSTAKTKASPSWSPFTFATYLGRKTARVDDWQRHPLHAFDVVILFCLLAAAFFVRWPFIARGETLLHSDEAIVGIMAQDIAEGQNFPIYFYGQRYMGSLEAYVVAAFSHVFPNPIHALRAGPACFFALMVAVQYLMLTRWFGRRGGIIGAIALLAAPPMFLQWSISARGGYVEILLVGSLLLWAYSEWFVEPRPLARRSLHHFIFGMLVGLGLWINPCVVLFIAPIITHAIMNKPLQLLTIHEKAGLVLSRLRRFLGRTMLPVLVLDALLLATFVSSTWVENGRVQRALFSGIFPKPIAALLMIFLAVSIVSYLILCTNLLPRVRVLLTDSKMLVFGILFGACPAIVYAIQVILRSHELEPALPLGMRPFGMIGETLIYLSKGLPLFFSADPRPFTSLVSVGRDTVIQQLQADTSALVHGATIIAIGALLTIALTLLYCERRNLGRLFRVEPTNHAPAGFLTMGLLIGVVLYVMGGCTLDFTTIRYLIPIWVFIPGLLAAVFVNTDFKIAGRVAPLAVCVAWAVGHYAMYQELGRPHPLRGVSDRLVAHNIKTAVAEPLDAHLLSYLTQQKCHTIEFESFWPRLTQYYPLIKADQPMDYVVQTTVVDRNNDWIAGGWPGQSPPETKRFLWPRLRHALAADPSLLVSRKPLVDGYELIRLKRPLRDRTIASTR